MQESELDLIINLGRRIQTEHDFRRILHLILSTALQLSKCEAGTIYIKNEDSLLFAVSRNLPMEEKNHMDKLWNLPPVPLTENHICALALLEKRTISIQDAYSEDCPYNLTGLKEYDKKTGYKTRSIVVIPLIDRNRVQIGVLQMINALDRKKNITVFSERSISVLEFLAFHASNEIRSYEYSMQMEDLRQVIHAIKQSGDYSENDEKQMASLEDGIRQYVNQAQNNDLDNQNFSGENLDAGIRKYLLMGQQADQAFETVRSYVFRSHLRDAEIASRAQLSRSTWSSMYNGRRKLTKKNLLPVIIALSLSLQEATELLNQNGTGFVMDDPRDRIIQFYIFYHEEHGILNRMNVLDLNLYLEKYHQPLLGEGIRK